MLRAIAPSFPWRCDALGRVQACCQAECCATKCALHSLRSSAVSYTLLHSLQHRGFGENWPPYRTVSTRREAQDCSHRVSCGQKFSSFDGRLSLTTELKQARVKHSLWWPVAAEGRRLTLFKFACHPPLMKRDNAWHCPFSRGECVYIPEP